MVNSDEGLQELWNQIEDLQQNRNNLITEFSIKQLTNEKTNEFADHGLCRRLSLMTWGIE